MLCFSALPFLTFFSFLCFGFFYSFLFLKKLSTLALPRVSLHPIRMCSSIPNHLVTTQESRYHYDAQPREDTYTYTHLGLIGSIASPSQTSGNIMPPLTVWTQETTVFSGRSPFFSSRLIPLIYTSPCIFTHNINIRYILFLLFL